MANALKPHGILVFPSKVMQCWQISGLTFWQRSIRERRNSVITEAEKLAKCFDAGNFSCFTLQREIFVAFQFLGLEDYINNLINFLIHEPLYYIDF